MELSEQEQIRRQSLQALRDMGIEPYPAQEYVVTGFSTDVKALFVDPELDEEGNALPPKTREEGKWYTGDEISIAGRLMSKRIMGKASFAELQDSKGRIQVYVSRDDITTEAQPEMYNTVFKKLLDIGDFIGIKGFVFRTKMGEISIHAKELTVLSKSLRPLPIVKYKDGVAYDGFNDPEQRYRQRYVDLVVNEGVKDTFLKRATILRTMRQVFDEAGYTEVETPILQQIAGGASARPFITHHNTLDVDMYLRIATELYLKRLIVGGFEGVYEIGRNFRNEGMDRNHNPEFTCMELYVCYKDYNWMMTFTENLLEKICLAVNGTTEVQIGDHTVSFKAPYRRLP
ncbi:MAG: lysine--tRNA ligase, partial [Paludibacteraceae bacterium]|nr:lysine--tRNA ligase [Paludibacteraceae bacterium]